MADTSWVLLLITYLCYVADANNNECISKRYCNDCISALYGCAWCNDTDFSDDRCNFNAKLHGSGCVDIFFPTNNHTLLQADELSDGTADKNPVQVYPQKVKVKLRPGEVHKIKMNYRVARNVPMDMYFVLDFSTTMKNRLASLANLTALLIDKLRNEYAENIHIGFGSFLDKTVQPFHVTTPSYLANPCILTKDTVCEPSYGFKHKQALSKDSETFIKRLRHANTSANYDPMEGGLDAVVQAAVCKDVIGWRNESRKVMVFISDAGFHFAGDGKLAGIDKPNDGLCHLEKIKNSKNEYIYTMSTEQDYPSLEQVKVLLDEHAINTIFVVKDKFKGMYGAFTDMMKQADTVAMDEKRADDIVEKVKSFYSEITKKVEMVGVGIPEKMDVKLASKCIDGVKTTYDMKTQVLKCTGLDLVENNQVDIDVELKLLSCPDDASSDTFRLKPVGHQEYLALEVEYICDCNCPKSPELETEKCTNKNGTYECGACRCNQGRSGEKCQCDKENTSDFTKNNCIRNNNTDMVCENHGTCKCGECSCNKRYSGKYCECDNNPCYNPNNNNNEACSGHGACRCGKCECHSSYTGEYCDCKMGNICPTENELECNGHGNCICGICECDTGYLPDTNCKDCPGCELCKPCQETCIKCLLSHKHHNMVDLTTLGKCINECQVDNVSIQEFFVNEDGRTQRPCGIQDPRDSTCEISYMVMCKKAKHDPVLIIADKKQCVLPPDPLLIAMPILAGIIGVGILLLIIWKILTSFYDKIEYARFEHEIKNPKWSQEDNPIYKTATTSNQNPMFKDNAMAE